MAINAQAQTSTMKIGQILLKHTTLSDEQLNHALEIQTKEGGLLGEILIRKKIIMPHEIMRALCLQIGLDFRDELKPMDIDPSLVTGIPMNYAKNHEIVPIAMQEIDGRETLVVASADPFNQNVVDDLRVLTDKPVRLVVSTGMRIQEAINSVYERNTASLVDDIEGEFAEDAFDLEGPIDILEATENDAPVIKFVNSLIFRAVKEKASDIHIEPYEKEFVVRFRRDGILHDVIRQPKRAHAAISSRIKVMGQLDIAEKRMPQDGRIKIKIAGKDIDIRLSTVPTNFGERVVMRLLETSGTILTLEQLGFDAETRTEMEKLIHRKYGIILVTGPTGSGKSTTLSACLIKLNSPDRNILTVEDPIEYQIPGVSQVQVNSKINLSFARALRSFLRQDPDVIMVGEIRDGETAEIAINASLTGHLVLSTIHTNEASGSPTRLIDMGVEPFLVASSLLGVVAQRLIRVTCTKCREVHHPTDIELREMQISEVPEGKTIYRAVGCPSCNNTGYSGRTVLYELMMVDDDVREAIVQRVDSAALRKIAVKNGMRTLRDTGVAKVLEGTTTVDELIRATHTEA